MQQTGNAARVFEDHVAVRGATPLLFGIVGPSGSGKTFSALRLATGMQRVCGGDIYFIDTESNRALHYAEKFKFRHVPFRAPFGPLEYLAAIEHCQRKGAKIVIVDSMSHEHEGPGGVLEMHAAEIERLLKLWRNTTEDKVNMSAWGKPKGERRKMINAIIQMPVNFIFCFRAKEKVKIGGGKVEQLGFMPIAAEEFVYELTAKSLLLPGAGGVPTWQPQKPGEKLMVKIPEQFRAIFNGAAGQPLGEDVGEQLATWASGSKASALVQEYAAAADQATFEALEKRRSDEWPKLTPIEKKVVKGASDDAAKRLAGGAPTSEADAIATLEAAFKKGDEALESAWTEIAGQFADIPLPVDAKYVELREALKTREQ